eukprot:gnl/MRDRNA2_/MRDRNA2_110370_c0_seq1.p1 gnl/MRDRNA2_/MRDRNA2_110370_c0~~gnl/MRDRNA2_/MRDRNA2_110370_c0_seq1.p1  ORF type:complete len:265 (-),score=56.82 gnl/MRDRNA2_/MRDRNA2_110370_c0_seq1:13-807(-)
MEVDLKTLQKQLQADDGFLTETLNGSVFEGPAAAQKLEDAQSAIARMRRALVELKAVAAKAPPQQRPALDRQCADYTKRLEGYEALQRKSTLSAKSQADNKSREALLGGPKARPKRKAEMTQEENDQREFCTLAATRDKMREELQRMEAVGERLEDSSQTIHNTQNEYNTYTQRLASAKQTLGQLKRKTEEDSRYIWYSFYYFIGVVIYIVLKRLKVFWVAGKTINLTVWSGQTGWSILSGAYGTFCDVFGIPNILEEGIDWNA